MTYENFEEIFQVIKDEITKNRSIRPEDSTQHSLSTMNN